MVAYREIKSANAALSKIHESSTAVFVGATAGIGLATLKAFAKHIPKPKAIIVGRSKAKFQPELDNLKSINAKGEYIFLEAEVSLLKSIDTVCEDIKKRVSTIDLLYVSQGYMHWGARNNTPEGLDESYALRYYGRVLFTERLLPLMSKNARAISVLAGGKEGKVFTDDLDLERNYGMLNGMSHFSTLMTLSYEQLAAQNPEKGFVHVYPGFVNTGVLARGTSGVFAMVLRVVEAIGSWFNLQPEEVGERMLFYGTSEQYARGSWSLDWDGSVMNGGKALVGYRKEGLGEKVEEHNRGVFERVAAV